MTKNTNVKIVFDELNRMFPNPDCELDFNSNFELLIAVMLSAQCTDKRVNMVTKDLFKKYNKPQDFANLKQEDLEKLIYSTGFYHNKAKNIIKMSQQLINEYNGEVPNSASELEKLAGVGKKTANVVSSVAFGAKEIGVDTHIFRVTNRLGLVNSKSPNQTEKLWKQFYPEYLGDEYHYRLVLFGRYHCTARNPKCSECKLQSICKYYKEKDKINKA